MSSVTTVDCPTCKSKVQWTDKSPYRPFCSDRCKQIDFGGWAQESFAIKGSAIVDPELMDPEQLGAELLEAGLIDPKLLDK
jgi:endogenous inhibitor of DNA gyrase (YacG/DUF329 family)